MAEDIRPDEAVRVAKRWLANVYADESIAEIALEETRFREGNGKLRWPSSGLIASGKELNISRYMRPSETGFTKCLCWPERQSCHGDARPRGCLSVRKTLILDPNVLVLLLVGLADPAFIARHKNLSKYREEDFDRLRALID